MLGRLHRIWVRARAGWSLHAGRPEAAIEFCERQLQAHPDEPLLYLLLGQAYFRQKSYLRAYWSLTQAGQRLGRSLPAASDYWLGLSAYQLGRYEDCLTALERFCRRQGRFERHFSPSISRAQAIATRGSAHLKQGEIAQAIERFEEVVEAGAIEEPSIVLELASLYCLEEVGRYREAVVLLEDAVQRFPQEFELMKELSCAYSQIEENGRALFYARQCLALNPEDRWVHQQMVCLQAQGDQRDRAAARTELERLLEADPEDRWALDFQRYLQSRTRKRLDKAPYLRLVERGD